MPSSGSQTRARSEVVMVRLTPEEKATLDAAARLQGCSPPELLRRAFGVTQLIDQMQETETRDA